MNGGMLKMPDNNELTKREQQILEWIQQDPMISQNDLAKLAGISRSGAAAHISSLMKKGYLKGKGYIVAEKRYALVIGGINIDTYGMATQNFTTKTSNPGHISHQIGGLGRNMALNLRKLGVFNYFITAYGDDFWGEQFKADVANNNMDISYAKQFSNQKTSNYIYLNRANGERFIGLDDMGINDLITPEFLQQRLEIIKAAQYLIIDTNLPQTTIDWLAANYSGPLIAKAVSITKTGRLKSVLNQLDTLVINGVETPILTDIDPLNRALAERAAASLVKQGVTNVFLYVDGLGAVYANQKEIKYFKQPNSQILNTNGDGAAATAAIVFAKIKQMDFDLTGKMGTAAMAITAKSQESVNAEINSHLLIETANKIKVS